MARYLPDLDACMVQGLPDWADTFESVATVSTVLAAFCQPYSLNTQDCYLIHKTTRLDPAQLLQETLSSSQHQVCHAVTSDNNPAVLMLGLRNIFAAAAQPQSS